MWKYYSLKFPDKATADGLLFPSGAQRFTNTATIGTIMKDDGSAASGWHVNLALTSELPADLVPYEVFPLYPKLVWASQLEGALL